MWEWYFRIKRLLGLICLFLLFFFGFFIICVFCVSVFMSDEHLQFWGVMISLFVPTVLSSLSISAICSAKNQANSYDPRESFKVLQEIISDWSAIKLRNKRLSADEDSTKESYTEESSIHENPVNKSTDEESSIEESFDFHRFPIPEDLTPQIYADSLCADLKELKTLIAGANTILTFADSCMAFLMKAEILNWISHHQDVHLSETHDNDLSLVQNQISLYIDDFFRRTIDKIPITLKRIPEINDFISQIDSNKFFMETMTRAQRNHLSSIRQDFLERWPNYEELLIQIKEAETLSKLGEIENLSLLSVSPSKIIWEMKCKLRTLYTYLHDKHISISAFQEMVDQYERNCKASDLPLNARYALHQLFKYYREKLLLFVPLSQVDNMDGHEFESFCAQLLQMNGFSNVSVTPGSGDQGVDVLAEKDGIKYAIQCKCYSSNLGNQPIQEVHTGKAVYQCQIGVVMTNRYFTEGAKQAAKATGVLLWDRDKLEELLSYSLT